MTKKKLKLSLKKQVISRLNASSMSDVKGGAAGEGHTREVSCMAGPFSQDTILSVRPGICNPPPTMDKCPR